MSGFDCLLGPCDRIVVDVGRFGALGHGDFGGGGRIPPMSAMSYVNLDFRSGTVQPF